MVSAAGAGVGVGVGVGVGCWRWCWCWRRCWRRCGRRCGAWCDISNLHHKRIIVIVDTAAVVNLQRIGSGEIADEVSPVT